MPILWEVIRNAGFTGTSQKYNFMGCHQNKHACGERRPPAVVLARNISQNSKKHNVHKNPPVADTVDSSFDVSTLSDS